MRLYRGVLFAAALVVTATPDVHSQDIAKVTCRAFFASGHDNMNAIIAWLRGYHTGKTGMITGTDTAEIGAYGGRLGFYCRQHPDAGVIDASEQILSEQDHGL
jgi:hypothetical protein